MEILRFPASLNRVCAIGTQERSLPSSSTLFLSSPLLQSSPQPL